METVKIQIRRHGAILAPNARCYCGRPLSRGEMAYGVHEVGVPGAVIACPTCIAMLVSRPTLPVGEEKIEDQVCTVFADDCWWRAKPEPAPEPPQPDEPAP